MANPIRNVALLGADGKLGPTMLRELHASGFKVTVLKRKSSKSPSNYAQGVREIRLADSFEVEELKPALEGQDAVVVTIPGSQTDVQKRLAEAAVVAGVRHFIPADFGSCDSQSQRAMKLVPLYEEKTKMREYLQGLAEQHPHFAWTSLVCGHFFDWNLAFLHLWLREQRADIIDDGKTKFSASTLQQVAKATTAVLRNVHKDAVRNRLLYIQSFSADQNTILQAFQKVMTEKLGQGWMWNTNKVNSEQYIKEQKSKVDEGDKEAVEHVVWVLGTIEADWTQKSDFANERLELKDEPLDEVVRRVVNEHL